MKTFAIVNQKGGVGKTTTTLNLGYILATQYHMRVLLIDADNQGNTSSVLDAAEGEGGLAWLLQYGAGYYPELVCHTDVNGLDVLPSGQDLGDLDLECMTGKRQPDFWALKGFITTLTEDDAYDVCIIDCPPYFSLSCLNAIAAADSIIIPTDTDAYSATGMAKVVAQIDKIRSVSPTTRITGCLVTRWAKSEVSDGAVDYLRKESPVHVFETVIRTSTEKVRESTWARQAACQWSPFCNVSKDYREFARELLTLEGMIHHGEV